MEIQTTKVPGENNKHRVLMYAISTCVWCKRAKRFLKDNHIEYEYVDVDLSSLDDLRKVKRDILNRGGHLTYPTIIIDDKVLLTNPQEDELRKALEI
jgi:glutaredoxin-like protein NrdH